MSVWRLEWLRLVRTRRLVILAGVFVLFGASAAPLTRYTAELVTQLSTIQVTMPAPTAAQGISQYTSQAQQIGLLVFVFIVAGAVTIDARRESAIFLRTRVPRLARLLVPKYLVSAVAGMVAFDAGLLLAWYGTVVLLGAPAAAGMVAGMVISDVYLAFVAAVVLLAASLTTSTVVAAIAGVAGALALGVIGTWRPLGEWLPSHLLGALPDLAAGGSVGGYGRSLTVTVVATVALVAASVHLAARREL